MRHSLSEMPRQRPSPGARIRRHPVGRTPRISERQWRRWGAKSLADDLVTDRGVVSGRAATIPRFAETRPSIGRFVWKHGACVRSVRAGLGGIVVSKTHSMSLAFCRRGPAGGRRPGAGDRWFEREKTIPSGVSLVLGFFEVPQIGMRLKGHSRRVAMGTLAVPRKWQSPLRFDFVKSPGSGVEKVRKSRELVDFGYCG